MTLRLDHLEEDVPRHQGDIGSPRTDATLPKPGKTYLATAIGVLLVAYAAGLAGAVK